MLIYIPTCLASIDSMTLFFLQKEFEFKKGRRPPRIPTCATRPPVQQVEVCPRRLRCSTHSGSKCIVGIRVLSPNDACARSRRRRTLERNRTRSAARVVHARSCCQLTRSSSPLRKGTFSRSDEGQILFFSPGRH